MRLTAYYHNLADLLSQPNGKELWWLYFRGGSVGDRQRRVSVRVARRTWIPWGTRRRVNSIEAIWTTETLNMPKHQEKRRPPRRTASWTTKRQRGKSKVYRVRPRRTARQIGPEERWYKIALKKMATRATITSTRTVFRLTWQPAKTPTYQERAFCTGCRNV